MVLCSSRDVSRFYSTVSALLAARRERGVGDEKITSVRLRMHPMSDDVLRSERVSTWGLV
jgi:hypothetical protein